MCYVKTKCKQCKEYFLSKNGNRQYCTKCRPPPKRWSKRKLYENNDTYK